MINASSLNLRISSDESDSVGKGTVSCKDGSQGQFNFKGLTNLKGYGYGSSTRGPVTFTYGMTAEEAAKYLQKPFEALDKIIEERKKRDQEKMKNQRSSWSKKF